MNNIRTLNTTKEEKKTLLEENAANSSK